MGQIPGEIRTRADVQGTAVVACVMNGEPAGREMTVGTPDLLDNLRVGQPSTRCGRT
ncbi:hypothetical protein [Deinococcus apachensis]|uniref:hypothetical protein n=1 Tax=Deinococcus apachensis TaxID=309886 RepID=UPI000365E412|nr:hypothetical protein [Deinococcus apachensis]